ncbi:conserved hypothetical protein [Acidimicrobium ferrooxidans DSM 10331]|uniref:Low molecular weight antigen MTB12-like C-terminal domain-containing protein n=1 Tax=Acidimicrobium ferrooxidans (strain DSM 10331 / JCM 15462 / NBRC 103882 / ICP) TaxID=525909 RepID=C7M2D8_ACIFD|nr:hypothetical protein [Acidimicrobium ferrooxidans]ACU54927.1 conserved hypothetical protein [Acidimicrobium ferrooxidans DSM 10331]
MLTMHRVALAALMVAAGGASLTACGSTTTSSKPTTTSPTAAIKKSYTDFFAGTTSAATKISLLQNGREFADIIDGQASSSLAKSVQATVQKVTLTSGTTARVVYTLDVGGQPALKNQTGEAVKVGGHWLVGDGSFCGLLALEGVKNVPGCTSTAG